VHLAAWLHELVILSGGNAQESGEVAIARLEEHVGGGFVFTKNALPVVPASAAVPRTTSLEGKAPTPPTTGPKSKLVVLWDTLAERPSWQKVFGGVKGWFKVQCIDWYEIANLMDRINVGDEILGDEDEEREDGVVTRAPPAEE
jgi:hypothetical protein